MGTVKTDQPICNGEGIFIPKKIFEFPGLNWSERVLLSLIFHLDKEEEGRVCFANNRYFAKYIGCEVRNVGKMLTKFANLGLIYRNFHEKRIIGMGDAFLDDE